VTKPGTPPTPERLSLSVVRSLRWIILLSLGGIIAMSFWGLALSFGLWGAEDLGIGPSATDEAISVLGNIGSAAVGGLVGFLTRDLIVKLDQAGNLVESVEVEEE